MLQPRKKIKGKGEKNVAEPQNNGHTVLFLLCLIFLFVPFQDSAALHSTGWP